MFKTLNRRKKFVPMSRELENKLCIANSMGDITSRNKLITHNLPLVISIAIRYVGKGVELDELISEGNTGLITATTKYKLTDNNRFTTYAYFWIEGAILRRLKLNSTWNPRSLHNIMAQDDFIENETLSLSSEEDDEENVSYNNMLDDVKLELKKLPKRERDIINLYYGLGDDEFNIADIAKKYNISPNRVSSIIDESIRKIRGNIILDL